ncbi:MAG: hypothetical protein ACK6DB_03065, partial [Planctomycetota bacterium]
MDRGDQALFSPARFPDQPPPVPATQLLGAIHQQDRFRRLVETRIEEPCMTLAIELRTSSPADAPGRPQPRVELIEQGCFSTAVWAADQPAKVEALQGLTMGLPIVQQKTEREVVGSRDRQRIQSGGTPSIPDLSLPVIGHQSAPCGRLIWTSSPLGPST